MNPKVSVIIPVYNTQPDLIQMAIDSVLNQSLQGIEIIVVDDGSTDKNTLNYLETITNKQIMVIHQKNLGLGGARNTGIANAHGKYIGFLDSDDYVDTDFYKTLYELCESNDCKVACGMLTLMDKNKNVQPYDVHTSCISNDLCKIMPLITNGSVCSKLFNSSIFKKLRFPEHLYYEDNIVLVSALCATRNVAFTDTVNYYYCTHATSIVHNPDPKKIEKRLKDSITILKQIEHVVQKRASKQKYVVMKQFLNILLNHRAYKNNPEYRAEIDKNFGQYLTKKIKKQSVWKFIFSIDKDTYNNRFLQIFGIKIIIKHHK